MVGDSVRVQNQTTVRPTKWDKTGVIMAILSDRKYKVMMEDSHHITTRNRRHLSRIPGKEVEVEEEEEHDIEEQLPVPSVPVPAPVPVPATVPALVFVEVQPEEPVSVHEPDQEETVAPRRSSRETGLPDRLVVTRNGKSYVDAVNHNLARAKRALWGKEDVSGHCGQCVHHRQCEANGPRGLPYLSCMVPNSAYNSYLFNKQLTSLVKS